MGLCASAQAASPRDKHEPESPAQPAAQREQPARQDQNQTSIAVVYYSTWGHVRTMAAEIAKGIEAAGAKATLYRVPETLSEEVRGKMHAAPQDESHELATPEILAAADGIIFGIPSRFGMAPAQAKALLDATGGLWMKGGLVGKPAAVFVSTGTQNGMNTLISSWVSQLTHHGMIFVPLGYRKDLSTLEEVHGVSPWGAGCLAGADGSRAVSDFEKDAARVQGQSFAEVASQLKKGRAE